MPGEKQLCHNRSAGQLYDHDFPRRIEWQDRCFVRRRIFRVLSNSRCRQQYFHGDQRHVRVEVVFLKTVLAPAIKWTKARFRRRSTHVPNLCPVCKVNALLRLQVGVFLMQNVFFLITFYYYWPVLKRKHCTQYDFYQTVAKYLVGVCPCKAYLKIGFLTYLHKHNMIMTLPCKMGKIKAITQQIFHCYLVWWDNTLQMTVFILESSHLGELM